MRPGTAGSLSVVLPALDEAEGIGHTLSDTLGALEHVMGLGTVAAFEVIVVDDGSTDATADITDAVAADRPEVRLVRHDRNRGVGAALRSGLAAAEGDLLLYTDADMPVDLRVLGDAVPLLDRPGTGMVAGRRANPGDEAGLRILASKAYDSLAGLVLGVPGVDVNFPFKLLRTATLREIELRSDGALVDVELIAGVRGLGLDVAPLLVDYRSRQFGESKTMTPRLLGQLAVELVRYRSRIRSAQRRTRRRSATGTRAA
jgi:glycosyltransferase involved in cell wall biosynthesis